jgi:PilZ domain
MDRLRELDQVTINLPREAARASERDFDCAVLAFDRATAILRPLDALPAGLPRTLTHVTMLFEHAGGAVGLNGVLILDAPYVLFTVEDGVQLPRRRATRAPLALPVTVRHDGTEHAGVTVNVAADGLLVEVDLTADVDDAVVAGLPFPEPTGAVEIPGRVVRAGDDGLVAIELQHGSPGTRAALVQLVLAVQTALLRDRLSG